MTRRDWHILWLGCLIGTVICALGSIVVLSLRTPKIIVKPTVAQQTNLNLTAINGVLTKCNEAVPSHQRNDAWWQCVTNGLNALDSRSTS